MLDQQRAFQHMAAWGIQNIFNVYKEEIAIKEDASLTDVDKALKINGPNGTSHRFLNLMLLLKPAIEQIELEYPAYKESFLPWFHDRWAHIVSLKAVEGECRCKGCKQDEPIVS